MKTTNFKEYFEDHTLRLEASRRGGGIEISASKYVGIRGAKMTAYQNYLGGGMLGSVQSDRNFETKDAIKQAKADKLAEELKKYFHNVTNGQAEDYDPWGAGDFEAIQARPGSAY